MNDLTELVNKGSDGEIIEFFIKKGILKIPLNCYDKISCNNNPLVLRERKSVGDQYWWKCNIFLSKFNLKLDKIVQLIYQWALQHCQIYNIYKEGRIFDDSSLTYVIYE